MSMVATELHKALTEAGTSEALAKRAAEEVPVRSETASKENLVGLRTEMVEWRAQTREDMAGLRTEMAGLRAQTREDMAKLRAEMAELRAQTREGIAGLRTEMAELRAQTREDMAALETRLTWRMLGGTAMMLSIAVALIEII